MGVPQVHSVCLTFSYLLQKNKKFMFCYAIAFRQFRLFFFKYPLWSECTNQITWDMMQAPGSKANEIAHCVCDNGS